MEDKKTILYNFAKKLFAEKGFKDTGIADIIKLAGFSVGTFYNYYPSKDKLFAEIFKNETSALMESILPSLDKKGEPAEIIRRLLVLNAEGMNANPILCQWYNPEVFNKIEKLYREENGLEAMDFLYNGFLKLVGQWQNEGKMRSDISSKMIMAIFEAIIRIGYHKEEIGIEYFPELQNRLTDFVLKGLTDIDY